MDQQTELLTAIRDILTRIETLMETMAKVQQDLVDQKRAGSAKS